MRIWADEYDDDSGLGDRESLCRVPGCDWPGEVGCLGMCSLHEHLLMDWDAFIESDPSYGWDLETTGAGTGVGGIVVLVTGRPTLGLLGPLVFYVWGRIRWRQSQR
jgi:hypothetical protein